MVCLLSNSGIYSPAWLVCLCRWATWEASRLKVPGGQEAFTDRQGRIIMYCNGGLLRKRRVTTPSTIQAVSLLQSDSVKLFSRRVNINAYIPRCAWVAQYLHRDMNKLAYHPAARDAHFPNKCFMLIMKRKIYHKAPETAGNDKADTCPDCRLKEQFFSLIQNTKYALHCETLTFWEIW